MEQEVFKYKKMVEHGVEANFDIINVLKVHHKKEMKEVWSSMTTLEEKMFELQGKIYDLQNQNCEYELRFSCLSSSAGNRAMDFEISTGGPLPWKDIIDNYRSNIHKEQAKWE